MQVIELSKAMTGICRHQHQHLAVRRKVRCHFLLVATSAAQQMSLQQNYRVHVPFLGTKAVVLSLTHAVSCTIQLFSSTEVPAKCIKASAVYTS